MSIREFAASKNWKVVGKLSRHVGHLEGETWQYWIDEDGNHYAKDGNGWFILTVDGSFID